MENTCEVVLYTHDNALSFMVNASCENFTARVTEGFENGLVVLETVENTTLIVSTLNVVAVEVRTVGAEK